VKPKGGICAEKVKGLRIKSGDDRNFQKKRKGARKHWEPSGGKKIIQKGGLDLTASHEKKVGKEEFLPGLDGRS